MLVLEERLHLGLVWGWDSAVMVKVRLEGKGKQYVSVQLPWEYVCVFAETDKPAQTDRGTACVSLELSTNCESDFRSCKV